MREKAVKNVNRKKKKKVKQWKQKPDINSRVIVAETQRGKCDGFSSKCSENH